MSSDFPRNPSNSIFSHSLHKKLLIMDVKCVDKMARESYANRPPQHDDDTGVDLVSCLGTGTIVGPRATVDIRLGVKCKLHE